MIFFPKPIRWAAERDRYFGPFTYAHEPRNPKLALMLGSGDGDDYPGCRLRVAIGARTLILALPPIIKPRHSEVMTPGGYYPQHEREYGFSAYADALHVHYGPQTHDSTTTRSNCWFWPWKETSHVRHSLYDLDGVLFANLPDWGLASAAGRNAYKVLNVIEAACPSAVFEFEDFDGEAITATTKIEEREWRRGRGVFRLLFLRRNIVRRSLDIRYSAEVGKRKGSWKGGTIGTSIDMLPGELHEAAFRRHCAENGLKFIGRRDPGAPTQVPA